MSASLDTTGRIYWAGCGCGGGRNKPASNAINPLQSPASPVINNSILPMQSPPGSDSIVIPATPAPTPGRTNVVIIPPRRRQAGSV